MSDLTPQEIEFEAWWKEIPEDERVAIFHKTQIRIAWNASWKVARATLTADVRAQLAEAQRARDAAEKVVEDLEISLKDAM